MELSVIQSKIYEIRGFRVMLDFELAEMYQVETRVLKQAVRRNINRFPEDFMFELTNSECDSLRSQSVISPSLSTGYTPFAFTEQGVAMLSSVLRSTKAVEVNINIMRAFVAVRNYLLQHISLSKEIEDLWKAINDLSEDNQKEFDDIYLALSELAAKQSKINQNPDAPRRAIGFVKPKK